MVVLTLFAGCAALLSSRVAAFRLNTGLSVVAKDGVEKPQDYSMDDAMRFLWYGYDMGHELQGLLARAPRTRHYLQRFHLEDAARNPNKSSPKLVILGPKDSGVSLLMETLMMNYWPEMREACGWEDHWIDHDRPWKGHLFCRAWPHGIWLADSNASAGAASFYEVMERHGVALEETAVLFVVKSPLATMQSWNTALRERHECIQRPAKEWDQPCTSHDMGWKEDGDRDRHHATHFSSTMDIYNQYMAMYHQLTKNPKFAKTMFMTYEDFVMDPADSVLKIAGMMNWRPLGDIEVQEGLPTNGFPASGRPLLVEQMRGRLWLGWTPAETRSLWCRGLNIDLFNDLTENSYRLDEFPYVKYGFDCA